MCNNSSFYRFYTNWANLRSVPALYSFDLPFPINMRGLSDLEPGDRSYAGRRFGTTMSFLADFVVDLREMRKLEDMLESPDRSVMAFKDANMNAVGSVSVTVRIIRLLRSPLQHLLISPQAALISQLSSTTLQLPGLSHVHWTAPGCIIASLLFGVLAVILATVQQQVLGMLNNPEGVRMWLSNGHFYPPHRLCRPRFDQSAREVDETACEHSHLASRAQYRGTAPTSKKRLQVSIAAMQLLSMPHRFLSAAVVFFLAGFALYLGFAFRQDLDDTPARNNNEAVFILFLAVATTAVMSGTGVSLWKLWEVRGAEKRSDMDSYGDDSGEGDAESDESGSAADESSPHTERHQRPKGKGPSRKDRQLKMAKALEESARLHRHIAQLIREEVDEDIQ